MGENKPAYSYREVNRFIRYLRYLPLTIQQKRTLKGQALSGDLDGAYRGLDTLCLKNKKNIGGLEHEKLRK